MFEKLNKFFMVLKLENAFIYIYEYNSYIQIKNSNKKDSRTTLIKF